MLKTLDNLDISKKTGGSTSPLDNSFPGLLPQVNKNSWDPSKFTVRYQKLSMEEPGDIIELERIETKAIRNNGIYVLAKKEFIFMDKIFVLINYLEEDLTKSDDQSEKDRKLVEILSNTSVKKVKTKTESDNKIKVE